MTRADVFAMSSRFEGLPTVLIEALYCGARVVSVDCPAGPSEILKEGEYGELVEVDDVEALASAIVRAADDIGDRPPDDAWRRFEEGRVVDAYVSACELALVRTKQKDLVQ